MALTVWDTVRTYELRSNRRAVAFFADFALFSGVALYYSIGNLWVPTQNFRHPGDKYAPSIIFCHFCYLCKSIVLYIKDNK